MKRLLFEAVEATDQGRYITARTLVNRIIADPEADPDILERARDLKSVLKQALKRERQGRGIVELDVGSHVLSGLDAPLGD